MELVAWLAGQAHSDSPSCTSPVVAALVRAWNDALPSDAARNYFLRPLLPRLVHTVGDAEVETSRGLLVLDCMVRTLLPAWLEQQGDGTRATALTALRPIRSPGAAIAVRAELGGEDAGAFLVDWSIRMATRGAVPSHWVPNAIRLLTMCLPTRHEVADELLHRLLRVGAGAAASPTR
ncbi:MAG: hypothetical protein KDC87_11585 [Planctomycetes bacterium]|nr:hypothetical protein [Planctomycetota bacterium]MCB9868818.1 hypothetical protein [Planctomycetota bacterium]